MHQISKTAVTLSRYLGRDVRPVQRDPGGGEAGQGGGVDAAVVPGHLVPAEVVGEDEDDVGSGSGGRGQPSEGQHGEAGPQHGHRSLHTHVYTCPWSHVSLVTRVTSHTCH